VHHLPAPWSRTSLLLEAITLGENAIHSYFVFICVQLPITMAQKPATAHVYDLFGPAMNICSKINHVARPNGLVIGQNLFNIIGGLDEYRFANAEDSSSSGIYPAYHVDSKEEMHVMNPFERKALY
jgi:hypothetical protein